MKKTKAQPLTEMEAYQLALSKINLREAVAPMVRGKIVEDEDTYNKVQQLLDCREMEHAHKFLLDIDFEDLTPETKQKVDDLYQLAISQGCIEADHDPEAAEEETDVSVKEETTDSGANQPTDNSGGFEKEAVPDPADAAAKDSIGADAPSFNSCAFVLFYSAMKNGQIKTGECYSNATTIDNAKLDAVQKLKKLGFTAIDILAAEECDPSAKGCDSRQPDEFGKKSYETVDAEPSADETKFSETMDAVPSAPAKKDKEEADNAKPDADAEKEDQKKEEKTEKAADGGEADKEDEEKPEEKKEDEEPSDEEDEEEKSDDGDKELSRSEKLEMFKEYLNEFKQLLQKMKAETYSEMSLADRAKFYDEMAKVWKDKPDPAQFMTDDNVDQIEHMRIKIVK